jgi:hypothetical protein
LQHVSEKRGRLPDVADGESNLADFVEAVHGRRVSEVPGN